MDHDSRLIFEAYSNSLFLSRQKANANFVEPEAPELVRDFNALRLRPDKQGFFNGDQLLGTLKNLLQPLEWNIYKDAGIEQAFHGQRISPEQAAKWLEDNSLKLELKPIYAADKKYSHVTGSTEKEQAVANAQHRLESVAEITNLGGPTDDIYLQIRDRNGILQTVTSITNIDNLLISNDAKTALTSYLEALNNYRQDIANRAEAQTAEAEEQSDSATAKYTMVNPKSLKEMPGAVDLLVRIPLRYPEEVRNFVANYRRALEAAPKEALDQMLNNTIRNSSALQRIRNVKEHLKNAVDDLRKGRLDDAKFKSDHYRKTGKNLVVHVRGYMETLPDGREVFFIFEIQSDWAQKYRDSQGDLESYDKTADAKRMAELPYRAYRVYYNFANGRDGLFSDVKANTPEEAVAKAREQFISQLSKNYAPDHPILKHYELLALKAAINYARKNGADAIAISDAETAMMSEGHDAHGALLPLQAKTHRGAIEEVAKIFAGYTDAPYRAIVEQDGKFFAQLTDEAAEAVSDKLIVPQDTGMRLHYDQILPKLAEELTGHKGTIVSFGDHQNAYGEQTNAGHMLIEGPDLATNPNGPYRVTNRNTGEVKIFDDHDAAYNYAEKQGRTLRKNLIFRNKQGQPKTDITARLYPINKVRTQFSTFGKDRSK